MSFMSVWGFDPEEASRVRPSCEACAGPANIFYGSDEERAALIPSGLDSQIYELRRIFRL